MAKSKSSANSLDIFGNMQKLNGKTSPEVKNEGLASPEPLPKYHVTFLNESSIFQEYDVEEGEKITYPNELPVKSPDSMFQYHFKGWDKTPETITEDTVLHAEYEKEALTFTVNFKLGDSIIQTEQVTYGELAAAPAQPIEKADDDLYRYTFAGWEPALSTPITAPTTFEAVFSRSELPAPIAVEEPVVPEKETVKMTVPAAPKETDEMTAPVKHKVGRPATKKGIAKKVNVLFTEDTMDIINIAKVFFDGNMTKYLETLIMEDYKKNQELYDTLAKTKRV